MAAEQFRRELSLEWLERELPDWSGPCPILAHVGPELGAGGRTSFMFRERQPYGWEMEIQGSRERILDSVLPHEVTHMIFATHFGGPLPRWADEGACTTVEHHQERRKQEQWLVQFLKTERGIPFNQMFAMTEYPSDILPLYSQGYSLARFLIVQGGRPKFVSFVGQGMETGRWSAAVTQYYGYESLGKLQQSWVDWVKQGSPSEMGPATAAPMQVASATLPRSAPPAAARPAGSRPLIDDSVALTAAPPAAAVANSSSIAATSSRSWYARRQTAGNFSPPPDASRPTGGAGQTGTSAHQNLVR